MSDIPTTCFNCEALLTYKPDCPNNTEAPHIVKWVCFNCYKKRTKDNKCAEETQ